MKKSGTFKTLWGSRFSKELNELAKKFSYSLSTDSALLSADIKTSMAHALMLGKVGLISEKESKQIVKGLWQVLATLKKTNMNQLHSSVEDIHTLIQETLEKKIGRLARKLHTARSRNDLVATSMRVYVKEKGLVLLQKICEFQSTLVSLAEKNDSVLIPGYTHLQRAQIVLVAHHLLAYVEMLHRDSARISEMVDRASESPLGACALAGTSLPIDRKYVAKLLGFKQPSANSIDAVSDRDFVMEFLSVVAILMTHLSRASEDLILWNSSEFGFVTLADEFATGSSLMPHKKNPDMLELTKGKAGRAYGNLMSVLTMMKGLPLAYNRDMQEDKRPLFDSILLAESSLDVLSGVFRTLTVNRKACELAVKDSFLYATDVLEYLVKRKVSFRDAHDIVGKMVHYALDSHLNLSGFSLETFQKFSGKFAKDVFDLFDPNRSVSSKTSFGSTNPRLVKSELLRWKKELKNQLHQLKKVVHHHA